MNMKSVYVCVFFLSYTSVNSVSLEESIIAADQNNKEWSAEQTDKESSAEKYSMHKKMFLPSLEGYFNSSRKKSDRVEKQNIGGNWSQLNKEDGVGADTQMGIRLRQNLFNGFSTINNMKAAENESNAAIHKLKANEQKLVLKVIEAYTNVWLGTKKVDALRRKEENFFKTLNSQETSLEAGVSTPSEVAAASANYQKAVYERISAEADLFSAESEFEKLTGLKVSKDIELPEIAFDLPESLDKLIELAMNNNSSIISAKLQEKAALKTLDATKGKLSPSCDLLLYASRDLSKKGPSETMGKRKETATNYAATIEVTVPIFTNDQYRGNTYSQINLDSQAALKARFSAEDTVLEIKKECVVTWNNYISATAMIQASRSAVKSAELSSESNLEETALGMKSNSDVWVKENNLLESRVDLANSQRQKLIAAVKMLALSGNLNIKSILGKIRKKNRSSSTVVVHNTKDTKSV